MLEHLGHSVDVVARRRRRDDRGRCGRLRRDPHGLPHARDGRLRRDDARSATASRRRATSAIIGLTAHDERQRCVEAGMDDDLAKPFALSDLARALERVGARRPRVVRRRARPRDRGSAAHARRSPRAPICCDKLQASFARDTPLRLLALRAAVERRRRRRRGLQRAHAQGQRRESRRARVVATCQADRGRRAGARSAAARAAAPRPRAAGRGRAGRAHAPRRDGLTRSTPRAAPEAVRGRSGAADRLDDLVDRAALDDVAVGARVAASPAS